MFVSDGESENDENLFDFRYDMLSNSRPGPNPPKRRKCYRPRINFDYPTDNQFTERFRLNRTQVEDLLLQLGPMLSPPSDRNCAAPAKHRLLLALRFFASNSFYYTTGDCHGYSKASVLRYFHVVVKAINSQLFKKLIRWPDSAADRREIGRRFYKLKSIGMPNICGAVDGTLVQIKAPTENEGQYVDRKGGHSINATAVAGPDLRFYYVSVRWPGAVSDVRVLKSSTCWTWFEDQHWRPFPGAAILGDSIYPLKDWLIPMSPGAVGELENFYQAHARTRRVVECAFGVLKERFQCLLGSIRVNPTFACEITKACMTLHNFCLNYADEPFDVDDLGDTDDVKSDSRMPKTPGAQLNAEGFEESASSDTENEEPVDQSAKSRLQKLQQSYFSLQASKA